MPMHNLGLLRSDTSAGGMVSVELRRLAAARRDVEDKIAGVSAVLAQTERDQLARDFADIERATEALRRMAPALQSGSRPPAARGRQPRPVWMLIGVLWLSTALVTAGAVVAIATLAG
jgi:hypothetical protein